MNYKKFLKTKQKKILDFGFQTKFKFNDNLFEFQKYSVNLALKKGRFALFFECGLGKTICQLEWARHIIKKTKKPWRDSFENQSPVFGFFGLDFVLPYEYKISAQAGIRNIDEAEFSIALSQGLLKD